MKGPNILTILERMENPDRKGPLISREKPGKDKPNCHKCEHQRDILGDAHSKCENKEANVVGYYHGVQQGWFFWPYNFDPTWLVSCDGFRKRNKR